MNISEKALFLIELIESNGYEAFAVGGCVRDAIMGKECNDTDITTSATPTKIEEILSANGIQFIETGLKHGTITALVDNKPFEITTYRTESEYKDNRHPENVTFVSDIREDLARRDFTINAIAYSKARGIVDEFDGRKDIDSKIIRAVGDPNKHFNEDALRIMRAIRFSSVLGFDIEKETEKAIFENKELLKNISVERIFTELSKLILGDNAFDVLMKYREVIAVCIPEIEPMFDCAQNSPWHIYDVWTHTCKAIAVCPKELKLRLTMLFHDIGKPMSKTTDENGKDHFKGHQAVSAQITAPILKRLKVSNEIYDYLMMLIPIHDVLIANNDKNVKKWLNRLGQDSNGNYYLKEFAKVRTADRMAQNPEKTKPELDDMVNFIERIDKIIENNENITLKSLAVNGFDLIGLGIKGKEIGKALDLLLEKVIEEELDNDKEILLEYLKAK